MRQSSSASSDRPVPPCEPPAWRWLRRRRAGHADDVRSFVAEERLSALETVAVLLVEQRERRQLGERLSTESFFAWYPELRQNVEAAVELIYGEFLLCKHFGETPSPAEYQRRFPDYAEWLERQFALHSALQSSGVRSVDTVDHVPDESTAEGRGVHAESWQAPPGRFELLEEIARGGMGAVLRCRDHHLKRDLAVKVLHEKLRDREDVRRRFFEEARISGQLQHPGIVPIHELGTLPDGRPFFAMKLVQGRTLADLLKERSDPSQDRQRFVGVFLQVCQATAFAHSKGVIHRDLKPANVMVGEFGEVQVMDWSLAKVLSDADAAPNDPPTSEPQADSHELTQTGTVLGTFAYMPPEQARSELSRIGRPSDVFGLGAILCAVLTGKSPYLGHRPDEVLQQAQQGQLDSAFERLDKSGADVELVSLAKHCLQPRLEDRPADATAVVDAVAAYLAGVEQRLRQAEAERAAVQARMIEERKRRRLRYGLIVALTALLLVGGGAAWWFREQEIQRHASVMAGLEQIGPLREKERWKEMRFILERTKERLGASDSQKLHDQVKQELKLLSVVERIEVLRLKKSEWVAGSSILDQVDAQYARLFQESEIATLQEAPAVVAERIRQSPIKLQLIAALDDWWSMAVGNPSLARWLIDVSRLADSSGLRQELLDAQVGKNPTALKQRLAQVKGAEWSSSLAVAFGMRLRGPNDIGIPLMMEAQRAHPTDFWLAFALGYTLDQADRKKEAVAYYRIALALRPEAAQVHLNLAGTLTELRQWDEALAEFKKALECNPQQAAEIYRCQAQILSEHRKFDQALELLRKAMKENDQLDKVHTDYGVVLAFKGETAQAADAYDKALKLNPNSAVTLLNLGNLLKEQRNPEEAFKRYQQAVQADQNNAEAQYNFGIALTERRLLTQAVDAYRQAVNIKPKDSRFHNNLGISLFQLRKFDEAMKEFAEAVKLDPLSAEAHNNYGNSLSGKGRLDEAIAEFTRAVELNKKYGPAYASLGEALFAQGRYSDAVERFGTALKVLPPNHWARSPAADRLKKSQRCVALDRSLPAFLKGEAKPDTIQDALLVAEMCGKHKKLYAASARFYGEVLNDLRKPSEEEAPSLRYHAACAAAPAGCGQGEDSAFLSDKERLRLRQQALDWLKAELAEWQPSAEDKDPKAREAVRMTLEDWKTNPELACVCEPNAIAKMPEVEREPWLQFWSEVNGTLKKAAANERSLNDP